MKKISIGEIIVAVIIIVLVVFVAVPRGRVLVLKAQEGVTKGNLGALRNAISLYYATNEGRFPGANIAEALVAGGFIEQIPYVYTPPHHPRNNIIITGLSDTDESLGAGSWGYQCTPDPDSPRQWGEIWINSSQLCSRGIAWDQY